MKLLRLLIIPFFIAPYAQANQYSPAGFYIGYGAHTIAKSIPFPLIEIGYNSRNFSSRLRTGVFVGRSAFELAFRHDKTLRLYPYIATGFNSYVVGADRFYGTGFEYVTESGMHYALFEWTYLKYSSTRFGNKDLSENTLSLGFGRRF